MFTYGKSCYSSQKKRTCDIFTRDVQTTVIQFTRNHKCSKKADSYLPKRIHFYSYPLNFICQVICSPQKWNPESGSKERKMMWVWQNVDRNRRTETRINSLHTRVMYVNWVIVIHIWSNISDTLLMSSQSINDGATMGTNGRSIIK